MTRRELSHAKFGTLRRFSKEPAELPSLLIAVTKLLKIILEHFLMGAKEFAVAPPYLLKVLRALPWVCGYRGHLDIE